MKTLRFIGIALLTVLMSVAISSCSSSSDDDGNNGGGVITPEPVVEKQLKSYGSYKFNYDEQGRITSWTDGRNKNVTYTYSDNSIEVIYTTLWYDSEDKLYDTKRTYTLQNGRISKTSLHSIKYDSNGYALSLDSNNKLSWLDGDLIEIDYTLGRNRTLKYTNIPCPKNLIFVLDFFHEYPIELLMYMGYLGKRTNYLPSEMVYYEKHKPQITYKYDWTIKNGYPTQVKISESNGNDETLIFNYQ